jgi:hypothetical protein
MKTLSTIIISFLISFGTVVFVLNVPVQWFSLQNLLPAHHVFGTVSLTNIVGTNLLSNFPTTYNANDLALNNGKEDILDLQSTSTLAIPTLTSLSSIGTITSGIWHGSVINYQYGGTGSSSFSGYQVLLGSSTNGFQDVSGWGASGQFLTSNGFNVAPTWQSGTFDQTKNYILTGIWNFGALVNLNSSLNATGTSLIENLNASSTASNPLVLNTVSFDTPATQGASSTSLVNDGNGHLKWQARGATTTQATNTFAAPTGQGGTGTGTVTCPGNSQVTGGGYSGLPNPPNNGSGNTYITTNAPVNFQSWTVTVFCGNTSCNSGTITVYAICVNP